MNFYDILAAIGQADPEVYDRLDSRRAAFKHLSGVGQKLTAAALPLFVGAVLNKAYAQTPAGLQVNDVLNFALKLEYLEMYFYQQRTALTGISTSNLNSLAIIATDEANHVGFLRSVLGTNAIAAPASTQFDYSASRISSTSTTGPFGNWRTNADTYLALAQAFEDTGVRAYKGVAPLTSVMANKTVLAATLGIHGIEARHAARIRAIRRAGPNSTNASQGVSTGTLPSSPKSWISGNDGGGPAPTYTAPVYGAGNSTGAATYGPGGQVGINAGVLFPAEDSTTQGGIALSGASLPGAAGFPTSAFSEAFDEGLDVSTVSSIARQFTISTSTLFG